MPHPTEQLLLAEMQVLLAEKRTYYAILRSAIAIFTLPLTVIAFLIATSKFHGLFDNPWLSTVVVGVLAIVSTTGLAALARSQRRISKINSMVEKIRSSNKRIAEIVLE